MDIELRYTDEEIAVIDGVIASICPRMPQESLQNASAAPMSICMRATPTRPIFAAS